MEKAKQPNRIALRAAAAVAAVGSLVMAGAEAESALADVQGVAVSVGCHAVSTGNVVKITDNRDTISFTHLTGYKADNSEGFSADVKQDPHSSRDFVFSDALKSGKLSEPSTGDVTNFQINCDPVVSTSSSTTSTTRSPETSTSTSTTTTSTTLAPSAPLSPAPELIEPKLPTEAVLPQDPAPYQSQYQDGQYQFQGEGRQFQSQQPNATMHPLAPAIGQVQHLATQNPHVGLTRFPDTL